MISEHLAIPRWSVRTSIDKYKLHGHCNPLPRSKLRRIWLNIDDAVIKKCVLSMPKRLHAVRNSKGGHTKYR
ncbi:hypothetical protein JG687_00004640 [Phytophthora cactorum]|uniref:Uncharacterized protein n=1 Tax=Phytophthora cactorum TaxID=29920 RepID=A0A8T1USR1_9STRA|nr:hypothetical protein JG687_00004640 [Phytophthora cactorum]